MPIVFRRGVGRDLADAYGWYEEQRLRLARAVHVHAGAHARPLEKAKAPAGALHPATEALGGSGGRMIARSFLRREQDAFAEFVLAELDLRAQYVEAAKDSTREGEARAWVGGIENPARRAGWEARFRRAGAGRVRENLWGDVPPDAPLDR